MAVALSHSTTSFGQHANDQNGQDEEHQDEDTQDERMIRINKGDTQ